MRIAEGQLRRIIKDELVLKEGSLNIQGPEGSNLEEYLRLVSAAGKEYHVEEKGLIMLWGDLLYIVYHRTPAGRLTDESFDGLTDLATEYFHARGRGDQEAAEDIMDWVTDGKGCPRRGVLHCCRAAVDEMLADAARKTPTQAPLTITRTGRTGVGVWASWTAAAEAYDGSMISGRKTVETVTLKPGTPVIAAHGLADDWEIIARVEPSNIV